MLYVIPDTLLKVELNTNKTGHHVILYTDTNHVMHYNWHIVESGAKHVKTVTMLYLYMVATIVYAMHDILLKVAFNTSKTDHHVIRYNWDIVESGIQQQLNCSPWYIL